MAKSILMASFVKASELYEALDQISINAKISKNQIFVFKNLKNDGEYIFTFNINSENANIKFTSIWKNTISIHRKKQTNTLYSINAMNEYIKEKNGGVLNKNYRIRWEDFQNSIMVVKRGKLNVIPITLIKLNQ